MRLTCWGPLGPAPTKKRPLVSEKARKVYSSAPSRSCSRSKRLFYGTYPSCSPPSGSVATTLYQDTPPNATCCPLSLDGRGLGVRVLPGSGALFADAASAPRGWGLVTVHSPGRQGVQLQERRVGVDEPVEGDYTPGEMRTLFMMQKGKGRGCPRAPRPFRKRCNGYRRVATKRCRYRTRRRRPVSPAAPPRRGGPGAIGAGRAATSSLSPAASFQRGP